MKLTVSRSVAFALGLAPLLRPCNGTPVAPSPSESFTATDPSVCIPSPCLHGGVCVEIDDTYVCHCAGTGYANPNCSVDVDECLANPCQNGGSCTNLPGSYTCTCVDGYTGTNCENSHSGSPLECTDFVCWNDNKNDNCYYYEVFGCEGAEAYADYDGVSAFDACCTCDGGVIGECTDVTGWADSAGRNCDYYELFGCSEALKYARDDGVSAFEACCTCCGGACTDIPGWVDIEGDDCSFYELYKRCGRALEYANEDGVSALDACCACGGVVTDPRALALFTFTTSPAPTGAPSDYGCDGVRCILSSDICPTQFDFGCDHRTAGSGCEDLCYSDCFDCDPLVLDYREDCDACIGKGGWYCEFERNGEAKRVCSSGYIVDQMPGRACPGGGTAYSRVCSVPAPAPLPVPQPVPVPTPPSGPNPSPSPEPDVCFSGQSTVIVRGQGVKRIEKLKIGDYVLTAGGTYSKVYSFGHRAPNKTVQYLQVLAEGMNQPLEISSEHLIYISEETGMLKSLIPAGRLIVDDYLIMPDQGLSKIQSISTVVRKGAYSPLTSSGSLTVNGVEVSSYVFRNWLPWSGHNLHCLQHAGVLPLRAYCYVIGGCAQESYDERTGFNSWVQFWYRIEQWQLNVCSSVRIPFMSVFIVFAILLVELGKVVLASWRITVVYFALPFLGYFIWKKTEVPWNLVSAKHDIKKTRNKNSHLVVSKIKAD